MDSRFENGAFKSAKLRNLASARPAKIEKIVEIFVQKKCGKVLQLYQFFS